MLRCKYMNSDNFVSLIFIFILCIMNKTFSDLDSIIQLSKDTDTLGFDLSAGQTWIYPTNYQVRDYQYNITQAALHNNTLVSLPTGLGKTFIAAVVMYNFYRWYPMGKIIFMAPTRPLVKQQQDACYNIMAIPPDATAEMTGNKVKTSRVKIWKEKRVFFITPQILQNDIDVVLDLAQQIKCLVIDEAHKALGKHANCEAIKKIHKINKYFRVLALSATPGSNFNSIKDVITNLLISRIEVRTNESTDVAPFVFKRKLETFVIPITGQLLAVKNKYILVLDKYTRPLLQFNIFSGNCANLTKGRIVLTMKEFKEKGRHHAKYSYILKTLNLCVTLYHGYELLIRHGLRGFLVFFDGTISKPLIGSIQELPGILDDVRNYIGPQQDVGMLPDGTIPEIDGPMVFSHPKFEKLDSVVTEHFKLIEDGDTRVMVFCEYRESVMEIYQMLLRQRPLIKPRVFLGQGAISQAQQLQAVKQFKSGICNTLISTCIGEEGLDVGEVDLIVCFDISSKSPIRMVQRMGRTGRKRDGRVVVLVTEGKEQQLLSDCMVQKNNMNSLLESQQIKQQLYTDNPKMIPENMNPTCNKMFITVKEPEKPKKKETKKKNTKVAKNSNSLKTMFDNMPSQSSSKNNEEEDPEFVTNKKKSPVKASRGPKKLQAPSKNQMDLRSMFSKISNTQNTLNSSIVCSQEQSETTETCAELNTLVTKIKSFLNMDIRNKSSCKICGVFNNKMICSTISKKSSMKWTKPNLSILDSFTSESLTKFSESMVPNKTLNASSSKRTIYNKSKSSDTTHFNNTSTKTTIANNSLSFFNLESTCDVFSDDSTEVEELNENPILFNNSLGIFESSRIYHSPAKLDMFATNTPDLKQNQNDYINNLNKNDIFETEEDIIADSDCDSPSPVLCSQRFVSVKQKMQRRLFSQTNSESINYDQNQHITNEISDTCSTTINQQASVIQQNINNISNKLITKNTSDNSNIVKQKCSTPKQNNLSEQSSIPCKNLNTASTSKNEVNLVFWDESLFEYNSEESLFEEEIEKNHDQNISSSYKENRNEVIEKLDKCMEEKSENENNFSSNCADKQTNTTDKLDIQQKICNEQNTDQIMLWSCTPDSNENINKLNNSIENKKDDSIDSDATIILSFDADQVLANLEEENLKVESKEQIDQPVIAANKSINNSTIDCSLLSVTQAINFLNNKSLDNSIKHNQNKITENTYFHNATLNTNTLNKIEVQENKSQLSNHSQISSIKTNKEITKNSENENKFELDALEISEIFKDFDDDSEEEFSLLSFSQNRKRKLQEITKSSNNENNNLKFAKTNINNEKQNTSQKCIAPNNNNSHLTKSICDNTKKLKNDSKMVSSRTENEEDKDFEQENNPFTISQRSKKPRNKKFKLQLTKSREVDKKTDSTKRTLTQISPLKVPPKKVVNVNKPVIVLSDSDDDFDVRPAIKPVSKLVTPVKKLQRMNSVPCYSKSNENSNENVQKSRSQSYTSKNKNIKSKKVGCAFIDDEAEVEDDEHYESDSDCDKDSEEQLDSSFVSYTQNVHDQTDMRAKYLQSIRSPHNKPGAFKMPNRPPPQVYDNVFSQVENYENETYMDDSFCVGNDETLSQRAGMSYLEMVEAQLEHDRKAKHSKKRKRIITLSDTDSD